MLEPRTRAPAPGSARREADAILALIGDAGLDALASALARLLLSAARNEGRARRSIGGVSSRPIRRATATTKSAARRG